MSLRRRKSPTSLDLKQITKKKTFQPTSFVNLPVDVIRDIILQMDIKNILNLCRVNKHIAQKACNDIFWKMVAKKYKINQIEGTWKKTVINLAKRTDDAYRYYKFGEPIPHRIKITKYNKINIKKIHENVGGTVCFKYDKKRRREIEVMSEDEKRRDLPWKYSIPLIYYDYVNDLFIAFSYTKEVADLVDDRQDIIEFKVNQNGYIKKLQMYSPFSELGLGEDIYAAVFENMNVDEIIKKYFGKNIKNVYRDLNKIRMMVTQLL
jgi:hypothetical protein